MIVAFLRSLQVTAFNEAAELVDMRSGSCSGTKCVAGSSTYPLRGVCALAARIRSADVIESHVPAR